MYKTIRYLRENHRYSQSYLALYLGVSRQMYIKYENGEVEPPVSIVRKLCSLYEVSYGALIDGDNKEKLAVYSSNESEGICVSEPATTYGISNQLNVAIDALKSLPADKVRNVISYIAFLSSETSGTTRKSLRDKSALLDSSIKIHIDEKDLEKFREECLV